MDRWWCAHHSTYIAVPQDTHLAAGAHAPHYTPGCCRLDTHLAAGVNNTLHNRLLLRTRHTPRLATGAHAMPPTWLLTGLTPASMSRSSCRAEKLVTPSDLMSPPAWKRWRDAQAREQKHTSANARVRSEGVDGLMVRGVESGVRGVRGGRQSAEAWKTEG